MLKNNMHRLLIIAEMLVLALPTSLFCLFFGLALLISSWFSLHSLVLPITLFTVFGMAGIIGLWAIALLYLLNRPIRQAWWNAAYLGVAVSLVSLPLAISVWLGQELPDVLLVISAGVFGSPLLIPLGHFVWIYRNR